MLRTIPINKITATFILNPANLFINTVYKMIHRVAPNVPPIQPSIVLFGLISVK